MHEYHYIIILYEDQIARLSFIMTPLSYRQWLRRSRPVVFDDELCELELSVIVVLHWCVDVNPVAGE